MTRSCVALAVLLLAAPALAQVPVNPDLCLVPVAAPADVDLGSPRQMTHEMLVLGQRPLLYPFDTSKGVWTIDAEHRLVRFPGASTRTGEPDRFATDTRRRRIVGVGSQSGVYVLDHGDTEMRLVRPVDPRGLGRPGGVRYSEQLGAFVIFDANGVFRLRRDADEVVPLREPAVTRLADGSFEIPVLDAKVVMRGRDVDLVFDDGGRSTVLTLPPRETVMDVKLGASGGGLLVRTESFEHTVSVDNPRRPYEKFGNVGRTVPNLTLPEMFGASGPVRIEATGIGKALQYESGALREVLPNGTTRGVPLPFDPRKTPIQTTADMVQPRLLIIITTDNVYALDGTFAPTRVSGGDQIGAGARLRGRMTPPTKLIIAGERSLWLIMDRTWSGPEPCAAP